jgi:hypothetical protein
MGSSRKHWTETIATELRKELGQMAEVTKGVFADVRPKPRRMSPKEKVAQFLSMPREQRQQLYADLGPEQYAEFIDENMNSLVNMIGPAAKNLMPYFYADEAPQEVAADSEAQAQQYLQGLADGTLDDTITDELMGE